jgi:signal transduction histidine kinase
MLVLYDITAQRQREQQLAVLNRVLRHNLRNETTVIAGYAELLAEDLTDSAQATQAATIAAASDRLNSIAEKARTFEHIRERATQPEQFTVEDLVAEVVQEYSATHADASIDWAVTPSALELRTDPVLLSMLLTNLVQNALVHSETPAHVRITAASATDEDESVRFEIRDNNEPIPDHEIETLRAGEETSLQHGQGIGLWIVYWCVRQLYADIDFAYDEGNVLTVTLPPMAS